MAKELSFRPVGQYGVEGAIGSDGFVYLRIPSDPAKAREPGVDPKTGDRKVYHMQASTGGWSGIDGTELRVSLNAGFKGLPQPAAKA